MAEPAPKPFWHHPCCDAPGTSTSTKSCGKCGAEGTYAGRHHPMFRGMARYRERYGVVPIGPHRKLADALLGALRSWCDQCDGLGFIGDEHSCRMCHVCEGAGSVWAASNEDIRAAYAQLLAEFPDATFGMPLPVFLIPDDVRQPEGGR
jgi:hypothetical protein